MQLFESGLECVKCAVKIDVSRQRTLVEIGQHVS